jgi:protocatechuate 3,4-dioxygenase beta subunit
MPMSAWSDGAISTQAEISGEIAAIAQEWAQAQVEERQPRLDYPPYRSSMLRNPARELHHTDPEALERTAPIFGPSDVDPLDADLTSQHIGEPIGERIVITGRVLDLNGTPVSSRLVEIWQANAAGRYYHRNDQHHAPVDPNFSGQGRCLTDSDGAYRFLTIKPGPYPWRNHHNAWRPAHVHFSVFGIAFSQRLVTQMYFAGDPLLDLDPIYQSLVDPRTRERLIATYDHDITKPETYTGYRWDILLGSTPTESAR